MKLVKKIFIQGKIVTRTGLHIGGTKTSLDIGGVDLNVIKTAAGVPYIPGSSLKGKLRSMLARAFGSLDVKKDPVEIKRIFGGPDKDDDKAKGHVTRLLVRDAFLDKDKFDKTFQQKELEFAYSGIKVENTIDRKRGTAQHPRQLERVPAGVYFDFEMVYDGYSIGGNEEEIQQDLEKIRTAMRMLEGDYIGGSGSRGYGKIEFEEVTFQYKDYKENNDLKIYDKIQF